MSNQPNLGEGVGIAHGPERRSVIAALATAGIAGPIIFAVGALVHSLLRPAKAEVTKKDPKEWIPVPVVDAGLERDLVDAARLAIADNKPPSKNADRFWELSGGIVHCGDCGRRMLATSRKSKVSQKGYYYYYVCQCGRYSWDDRCSHNRHHPATAVERQVWEGVSGFLSDPERMRRGLENLVAHEAKENGGLDAAFAYWGETLFQVKVKSERLLDLYL
jgi:hypothetical protein